MKYRAICGNTIRTIHGCATPKEALDYAVEVYNDCLDHTEDINIFDMNGNYLVGERGL